MNKIDKIEEKITKPNSITDIEEDIFTLFFSGNIVSVLVSIFPPNSSILPAFQVIDEGFFTLLLDGINFNDDTEMPEDGEDLTWVLNESEFIRFCSVITHAKALINDSRHDVWNLGAKYVIPFADAEDQPIRDDWLSLKKYNRDGLLSKEYFNV